MLRSREDCLSNAFVVCLVARASTLYCGASAGRGRLPAKPSIEGRRQTRFAPLPESQTDTPGMRGPRHTENSAVLVFHRAHLDCLCESDAIDRIARVPAAAAASVHRRHTPMPAREARQHQVAALLQRTD